jgi:hypothetical protein
MLFVAPVCVTSHAATGKSVHGGEILNDRCVSIFHVYQSTSANRRTAHPDYRKGN